MCAPVFEETVKRIIFPGKYFIPSEDKISMNILKKIVPLVCLFITKFLNACTKKVERSSSPSPIRTPHFWIITFPLLFLIFLVKYSRKPLKKAFLISFENFTIPYIQFDFRQGLCTHEPVINIIKRHSIPQLRPMHQRPIFRHGGDVW